ncbi:MAG TPA: hypothetical protein VMF08_08225 [Candidatus Sulfotelmatobacter sp.]|nr:hypothetical protein [Candidatus Sulfotelmatobacter sp.]
MAHCANDRFAADYPGGIDGNSPAFQRRVSGKKNPSPEGTAGLAPQIFIGKRAAFSRPFGTYTLRIGDPALKRRAISSRASGTGVLQPAPQESPTIFTVHRKRHIPPQVHQGLPE